MASGAKRWPIASMVIVLVFCLAAADSMVQSMRRLDRERRLARREAIKPTTPGSARELIAAVEKLPLMQQGDLIRAYHNDTVKWTGVVETIAMVKNGLGKEVPELVLKDPKEKTIEIVAYGIRRADFARLKQLKRNEKVQLIGRISDVQGKMVVLENVKILGT
jgi:hypothetical protein